MPSCATGRAARSLPRRFALADGVQDLSWTRVEARLVCPGLQGVSQVLLLGLDGPFGCKTLVNPHGTILIPPVRPKPEIDVAADPAIVRSQPVPPSVQG